MSARVERWRVAPDLEISRVLTGLWQVADMEREGPLDPETTARELAPYAAAGLTSFDMADHYGSAELIAGRFARGRGDVQLLTKWVPKPGPTSPARVREAVRLSLDRLQVERLDLLQFHAWSYADPSYLDALFALQELKQEGLIRQLGLTNVDTAHLRLILDSGIEIVSNQVSFSLLDRRARSGGMAALCRERGVTLLAFGVLAGGFLSERWLDRPEPDWEGELTWSQMKYGRFLREAGGWAAFQRLLHEVDAVARRHGVSVANVACRSILDEPGVGGVIVGARLGRSERIEDNLRVFDLELSDADRGRLDAAAAALAPIPGDCGDEYRRPPYLTASGDLSHHLESLPPPFETRRLADGRTLALSGTPWEDLAGFSRAVRRGRRVLVSGTTATHRDRPIGGASPASQTHFVIDKIEGALQSLGARLDDVVRTRVFVRELADWEAVARAHGERFARVRPANTLVQAGLIGSGYRVEIEAEAELGEAP